MTILQYFNQRCHNDLAQLLSWQVLVFSGTDTRYLPTVLNVSHYSHIWYIVAMSHPCHLLPEVAGSSDVINQWIGTLMIALHK